MDTSRKSHRRRRKQSSIKQQKQIIIIKNIYGWFHIKNLISHILLLLLLVCLFISLVFIIFNISCSTSLPLVHKKRISFFFPTLFRDHHKDIFILIILFSLYRLHCAVSFWIFCFLAALERQSIHYEALNSHLCMRCWWRKHFALKCVAKINFLIIAQQSPESKSSKVGLKQRKFLRITQEF